MHIDLITALNRLQGNTDMYDFFLDYFLENHNEWFSSLQSCYTDPNTEPSRLLIHNYKGLTEQLGVKEFHEFLSILNQQLLEGVPISAAQMRQIEADLNDSTHSLSALSRKHSHN